ncbi:MAG: transcription antitermination protein NusB [Paramuribaculum sp.]|nr:transcription antitermination protein NusB [Paramuribaculum sp.]
MINRVLIRIKVVQLLYSYLLTRSEFKIEQAPDSRSTKDRQTAYTLYLDLLLLLLELSGQKVRDEVPEACKMIAADKFLKASPMAKSLSTDSKIREIVLRGKNNVASFDSALVPIYNAVIASSPYLRHSKAKERNLASDVEFWSDVTLNVLPRVPEFIDTLRSRNEFSRNALDNAIAMVCRTLNSYNDSLSQVSEARNNLEKSLDQAHDLYMALLQLMIDVTDLQATRLEEAKHKYLPTQQDLTPDTRFIDNELIKILCENDELKEYRDSRPVSFLDDNEIAVGSILDDIIESDTYKEYMALSVTDYRTDCELWKNLLKNVILPSDTLAEILESKSVYWNDDLEIMGTFVIKTVKQFASSEKGGRDVKLQPKYKDREDAAFGSRLFLSVIDNRETYRSYIDRFINRSQWDSDRLAFMDIVIMMTAIGELLNFPAIPVPVTVNEYVEIANSYSTPKSGYFVNGVLSSVINYLKSEGLLLKNIRK